MKPPKFQKRNREVKVKRSCHGVDVALLCFAGFGGPQRQVWQLSHANFLYITLLRGSVAIKLNKMKIKDLNKFSNAEKIALAEQLWDSVSKKDITLSEEIEKELDERILLVEEGKTEYYTWQEVKNKIDKIR